MKREMMNQINRIVLNVLYRGLRVLYQKDSRVRAEMGSWAEGLSLKLVCGPGGAVLAVRRMSSTAFAACHGHSIRILQCGLRL